jgi:cellobiose phosphorylase
MRRHFRGKTVHIEVKNPSGVCRGVKTLTVDGQIVPGCVVPVEKLKDGSTIVAVLG